MTIGRPCTGILINYYFRTQNSSSEIFENTLVLDGGKVGIGKSDPASTLDVNGGITIQNNNNIQWGGSFGPNIPAISAAANSGLWFYPAGSTSGATMRIDPSGNVGIGTPHPDAKLAVKGTMHAQEVRVDLNGSMAPDYVFEKDYDLLSLKDLSDFIKKNKHLPGIQSAKELEEKGLNLKEMNLLLLKKVEE